MAERPMEVDAVAARWQGPSAASQRQSSPAGNKHEERSKSHRRKAEGAKFSP